MNLPTCLECGAALHDGLTCEAVFNEFLSLEFTDPEYGQVHMLTVACYMIQHGRYTDEALHWIEKSLQDYLEHGISSDQIRRQAAQEADQKRRRWKVTRTPEDPPQARIPWSMTIMDVADRLGWQNEMQFGSLHQDAERYRKLVRQWAATTLVEMQPLLA